MTAGHYMPIWYDEDTAPADGESATWNATTKRWEPRQAAAAAVAAEAAARIAADAAEASTRASADSTLTTNVATNASAISTETTRATTAEGLKLAKASNLSDVANAATALANLGGQATIPSGTYVQQLPASNGTDDAAQINALLAAGGRFRGRPGETYKIVSTPLVLFSNSELDLSGCTLAATGYAGRLIRNNRLGGAAISTTTTAAITAGARTLTVASWTVAPVVGNSVDIAGAGRGGGPLNTRITAVASSTSATVADAAVTTVSAASASLYNRDNDISLIGGTFTRDSTVSDTQMVAFHRADNIRVRTGSYTSLHGKYAIYFANCTNFRVLNPRFNCASDGIHISGPCSDFAVEGVTGYTNDDLVAMTGRDYVAYELTTGGGDIHDGVITKTTAEYAKEGVRLLGGLNAKCYDILIDKTGGAVTSGNMVALTDDSAVAFTTGLNADDITVRRTSGTVAQGYALVGLNGVGAGAITIDDVHHTTGTTPPTYGVQAFSLFTADTVVINNLRVMHATANITGFYFQAGSTVEALIVTKARAILDTTYAGARLGALYGTVTRFVLDGLVQVGGAQGIDLGTNAAVRATMSNLNIKQVNQWWVASGNCACKVAIANLITETIGISVFRMVGTTSALDLTVEGWQRISGTLIVRLASQVLRVNGASALTDVSLLTAADADIVNNSNAALACGAGLVVWSAAASKWKHVYSGTVYP